MPCDCADCDIGRTFTSKPPQQIRLTILLPSPRARILRCLLGALAGTLLVATIMTLPSHVVSDGALSSGWQLTDTLWMLTASAATGGIAGLAAALLVEPPLRWGLSQARAFLTITIAVAIGCISAVVLLTIRRATIQHFDDALIDYLPAGALVGLAVGIALTWWNARR